MTVYPNLWVTEPLGGYSSTMFNQAICCWATLMVDATVANEDRFSPEEWDFLRDSLNMTLTTGLLRNADYRNVFVGQWLANQVRDRNMIHAFSGSMYLLMKKLGELDYIHAWAAITSCQWSRRERYSGDAWWTLAARSQSQP